VSARRDRRDTHLVAYVVPRREATVSRETLVAFLREQLPESMVPSWFVFLDALPLTRQGKLDRASLPEPSGPVAAGGEGAAPRSAVERCVAEVFRDMLGVEVVGREHDFFELGGNSLLVAQAGARLCAAYDIELPLHEFFRFPTVAGVARTIEVYRRQGYDGLVAALDPAAMRRDAVLDAEITPDGLPVADFSDPSDLLLTGATGYLGIFLLERLLLETRARVHCLVRARDAGDVMERLRKAAATYRVRWRADFERRVLPLAGDLAKPGLGLEPETLERLGREVDAIYHNGALVNFTYPYSLLKAPNVEGTVEILRLACRSKAKALHYVSSIDVLAGTDTPAPYLEVETPEIPRRVPFGYSHSKWIAEKIVTIARSRGLPVTIHRPGLVFGHTETGACHETDYVLVALKGFLALGILPDYRDALNAIPVDYTAKAIVHASRQRESLGKIFHVWNKHPMPTTHTFDWVRSYGYDFELVSFEEAFDRAKAVDPSHPIYPLLPVLHLYVAGGTGRTDWDVYRTIDPAIECANTTRALEGTGVDFPGLDERYMHDALAFLVEAGHLDPPTRARRSA
jgi:thioester reductase-like protein